MRRDQQRGATRRPGRHRARRSTTASRLGGLHLGRHVVRQLPGLPGRLASARTASTSHGQFWGQFVNSRLRRSAAARSASRPATRSRGCSTRSRSASAAPERAADRATTGQAVEVRVVERSARATRLSRLRRHGGRRAHGADGRATLAFSEAGGLHAQGRARRLRALERLSLCVDPPGGGAVHVDGQDGADRDRQGAGLRQPRRARAGSPSAGRPATARGQRRVHLRPGGAPAGRAGRAVEAARVAAPARCPGASAACRARRTSSACARATGRRT